MTDDYEISQDGKTITCLQCGRVSSYLDDINYKYCGNCCKFHEDPKKIVCKYTTNPDTSSYKISFYEYQKTSIEFEIKKYDDLVNFLEILKKIDNVIFI